MWTQRRGGDGGMNWESGMDVYTLPCVKQIASGSLHYSTENLARCSVLTEMGGNGGMGERCKREEIYTYSWFTLVYGRNYRLPWWPIVVTNLPANATDARDRSSIPGLERSPGRRNGNPLQYPWLENSMDRGAWQGTAHRVAESQTRLKLTSYTRSLQSMGTWIEFVSCRCVKTV